MNIKWPTWHIDNAKAILEESRERAQYAYNNTTDEKQKAICNSQILALNLGISVIESIPEHTPPVPPSLKVVFRNTIGELVENLGSALESVGIKLQDANRWGWKDDPYDY